MPDDEVVELESPCEDCGENEQSCDDCNRCDDCGCDCTHCGDCGDKTDDVCPECYKCSDCCEHVRCQARRCRQPIVASVCDSCEGCESCCECHRCHHCGDVVDTYCSDCGFCDYCGCNCSDGDAPRYDGDFAYIGEFSKDMPRYTSLELEYASCSDKNGVEDACRNWSDFCVEDGSLPDSGFEINTNPTRGKAYFEHIRSIVSSMKSAGAELRDVCGLHVHVDARDLNWHDIYKLALLYMKVESALFAMQPRSRQDNHYCIRVDERYKLEPMEYKHKLLSRLYDGAIFPKDRKGTKPWLNIKKGKRVFAQRTEKYHSARYYALNLHTWFYRGTIEFRHAASTTNVEKATKWGLVCMWIVEKASKMSVAQINALPTDSTAALCSILPADVSLFVCQRQLEQESKR